jgi:hypothetical protein
MATYRAALSFQYDTAFPRDAISINPHFNGSDPQALATALSTNLKAYTPTAIHPWTIKIYDAAKAPPSYPLATASQSGTPPTSGCPREIALCLSYYTTYNRPRYRGRLYLPAWWFAATVTNNRPGDTELDAAIQFGKTVLGTGMPAQTNWVVWSKTENKAMGGVSNLWVDDEYDTMRSRGMKPTKRTTATFP